MLKPGALRVGVKTLHAINYSNVIYIYLSCMKSVIIVSLVLKSCREKSEKTHL